ncbi:MAG: glycosyltransferase family 4 protein, partial [Calditrichaeota bacterium]|nr:glycosyltransferase family 4 protein [Calditrichota bacterium]
MHVGILSEQLTKRGHSVVALCPRKSKIEQDLIKRKIPVYPFQPADYFSPRTLIKTCSLLRSEKIELLHVHYSKDLWTTIPAARLVGKLPTVFIKHIGTQKPKRDILHKWIYKNVCHTIAISQVIERNLLNTHPIEKDAVSVVHHGLDLDLYPQNGETRNRVREELGVAADQVLIGTIGRLEEGKGHLEFLEMAKNISQQFPKARFIIIGDTTRGEETRARRIYEKVNQVNLGKKLILSGFREDVPEVLSAMDIFAFPSHAEAFGLVVIEAMAASLPVVSSRCDGILDIVQDGQTGILVDPKNVGELTDAVRKLIMDAKKRIALGKNGRQRVEQ